MTNKTKAVIFMLLSALSFAFMQALIKQASNVPLFEKVFFRNLVAGIIAFISARQSGVCLFGKPENRKLLLTRSLIGVSGMVLYFYSIGHLFLADSSLLNKLSPFFVTLFAYLFLKEKLSRIQIPAMIVVFIAAILIIKPRFDYSVIPALAGFASAIFSGAAYTLVRYLGNREKPATIVFFFAFISQLVILPLMLTNFRMPNLQELLLLIGTGIFAAGGQFGLTYSYRYAPANEVAIYNYANIVFAALLGYFFWNEIPDTMSIIGGIMIIAVSLLVFLFNNHHQIISTGLKRAKTTVD